MLSLGAEIIVRLLTFFLQVSGFPGDEKMVFKPISFLYGVKIVFAFILIFVLGAIFTLFLDNLPALILYVKSIV